MKLSYKRTIFVGLAFLSICTFWELYDGIVPLILRDTFKIGDTLSGVVMALDNIFALFMLPLFGAWSDRANTRLGRRTPFIVIGTALAVAAMLVMPFADNTENFVLFIAALFVTLVAMSSYRSPAVALMPDVTPKPLRSKANAVINLMGAVGGVMSLLLISKLVPKEGKPDYFPLFAVVAGIMVLAVVVLIATTREKKLSALAAAIPGEESREAPKGKSEPLPAPVKKSLVFILISIFLWFMGYNAITTAFSKYATTVWGMEGGSFALTKLVGTIFAVLTYIPAGLVATKIGRKKTILGGIVLLIAAYFMAYFYTSYHWSVNIVLALTGIGWAAINVNSYPMVVEMARGSDIGRYTGYYYTFSMSAQVLTPILSGAMFDVVAAIARKSLAGSAGDIALRASQIGYRALFPYALLFAIAAFVTMRFVRHGDSRPAAPADKLELMDAGD